MFFLFGKKRPPSKKPDETKLKDGLWLKCPSCGEIIYKAHLEKELWVCPKCKYHFRINADKYIKILFDNKCNLLWENMETVDILDFPDYSSKIKKGQKKTGHKEAAIVCVDCYIDSMEVVGFFTDFFFMAGSMGSVVGEKFYRACKEAIKRHVPLIAVTGSGGGARMHEGIISLMQMVKTTVGVAELREAGLLYINVLTDPTMGGVMASFAALGDILIAEPKALLGFAGPRVIEQTIKQKLPPGFQRAEFMLEHGMVDIVVPRKDLKKTLSKILKILWYNNQNRG